MMPHTERNQRPVTDHKPTAISPQAAARNEERMWMLDVVWRRREEMTNV